MWRNAFRGPPMQKGYGLGGLFKSLARTFAPTLKQGLIKAGKKALKTGAEVIGDVAEGKNFKDAMKSRAKQNAKELFLPSINKINSRQNATRKRTVRARGSKQRKRRRLNDIFET